MGTDRPVDWSAFDGLASDRPGVVAAVARAGSTWEWRSVGAEGAGGAPLGAATPIYTASVAKQFTAAAIAGLVLDGTLQLEQRAARWLTEAPAWWQPITVAHLVSHTAGLAPRAVSERDDLAVSNEARLAAILATSPAEQPGAVHRYSNDGYVVLAEIARRASGLDLGELAARRLFEPAGMHDSHFVDVAGWDAVPGWIDDQRAETAVRSVGDGGLISTVADLQAWLRWYPRQPIAEVMLATRPLMPSRRTAHDAWGISIRRHHGQVIHSHGGSVAGYLASTVRVPSLDVAVVVLANDSHDPDGFRRRVHHLLDTNLAGDLDLSQPPLEHTHGTALEERSAPAAIEVEDVPGGVEGVAQHSPQ